MSGTFNTPSTPVLTAKAPQDQADWLADFTNTIPPGDKISAITSVTSSPTGITIGTTGIVAGLGGAGLAAGINLSGGSVGVSYLITSVVATVGGDAFARSFVLPVAVR